MTQQRQIRDLAILGDGRSAALVGRDGAIDWWCPGRFDAPALLDRLLDEGEGGFWRVTVAGAGRDQRHYEPGTNVLRRRVEGTDGVLEVTDFMPWSPHDRPSDAAAREEPSGSAPHRTGSSRERTETEVDPQVETGAQTDRPSRIVRRLEALAGEPRVEVTFRPTPDFGRARPETESIPSGLAFRAVSGGPPRAAGEALGSGPLHGDLVLVPVRGGDGGRREPPRLELREHSGTWRGAFRLPAGAIVTLVLTVGGDAGDGPAAGGGPGPRAPFDPEAALAETHAHWRRWSSRIGYDGPHREAVTRSALVLRLLVHQPSGALVAAPTTSLPEVLGGSRNWDYRFTWVRDTSLMLGALMRLGFHDEAMAFWSWAQTLELDRHQQGEAGGDGLRIAYAVDGSPVPEEAELPHRAGFRGSRPVRVGNGAATQQQLDACGYLLEAGHTCQVEMERPHPELQPVLRHCADHLAAAWRHRDHGIWEVRSERHHYLHSKLYAWIGLDRAVRLADRGWLPGDAATWRRERDEVRRALLEEGWHSGVGAFTQAFGRPELDATALLLPISGVLKAGDPRLVATVERVREALEVGPFVYRYRSDDGLPGDEGAFLLASFWLVEALAALGRRDEARERFARLVAAANDVGLLAEEIDPESGTFLGNFPQALSHLGLIQAALALDRGAAEASSGPRETQPNR